MRDNVIALNSTRPEKWTIFIGPKCGNSICCFYKENYQCWAGMVEVQSMDKLPEMLQMAQNAMKAARAQNRRVGVSM